MRSGGGWCVVALLAAFARGGAFAGEPAQAEKAELLPLEDGIQRWMHREGVGKPLLLRIGRASKQGLLLRDGCSVEAEKLVRVAAGALVPVAERNNPSESCGRVLVWREQPYTTRDGMVIGERVLGTAYALWSELEDAPVWSFESKGFRYDVRKADYELAWLGPYKARHTVDLFVRVSNGSGKDCVDGLRYLLKWLPKGEGRDPILADRKVLKIVTSGGQVEDRVLFESEPMPFLNGEGTVSTVRCGTGGGDAEHP